MENAFRDGLLKTTGTAVDRIMPRFHALPMAVDREKRKAFQMILTGELWAMYYNGNSTCHAS